MGLFGRLGTWVVGQLPLGVLQSITSITPTIYLSPPKAVFAQFFTLPFLPRVSTPPCSVLSHPFPSQLSPALPLSPFQRTRSMICFTTTGGLASDLSAVMSSLCGKPFNACRRRPQIRWGRTERRQKAIP
jgi:hypothetical protein